MSKVLILDGDSIAYRCAAAGEERYIKVTHGPTKITKNFKHRTEFKEKMQERGKEITSDYSVEDCQDPEPISFVISTMKKHIDRIVKEVNPTEIKIFAGERDNFRLDLPLPHKYKGNRQNTIRPIHLAEAKKYLQRMYDAKSAVGAESDDFCAIAAYDALRNDQQPVMYFYEKDQYQLDGVTLLHDNSSFEYEVVPELGNLRLEKTSVKGLGLKFLAYQWICSDPVDAYCAYDLSSVKFGAKSAYKVLNDCKTEQEVLIKVKEQFKKFYPEPFEYTSWQGDTHLGDWMSLMQMYYKCCRMMRSSNDSLDCRDLFNKYGVDL